MGYLERYTHSRSDLRSKFVGALAALAIVAVASGFSTTTLDAQCTVDRQTPPEAELFERFGASVSMSGDAAVVGAPGNDASGVDAGSALIYRRNLAGDAWPLEQILAPATITPDDSFGAAVAIDGNRLVVGAPLTGTAGPDTGNARIFEYVPLAGTWTQVGIIVASDSQQGDRFGTSVAIAGDAFIIGAPFEDERGTDAGAAYAYRRDPVSGFWLQEQKILPADLFTGDRFGNAVAIDGDVAVIGASGAFVSSGALYVYRYDPVLSSWAFEQRLTPADLALTDQFAVSVAISAGRILAGSFRDDDGGADSGSATTFLYDEITMSWVEEVKILSPDIAPGDRFGISVALSGGRAVIGATGDDPEGVQSGAAYLFEFDDTLGWTFVAELFDEPEGLPGDLYGNAVAIDGDNIVIGAEGHDGPLGEDTGVARFFETGGLDCNGNGISDRCDLLTGTSVDANLNGIPDECDFVAPVTDLTCTLTGTEVALTWTNAENYDALEVTVDDETPIVLLAGTTQFTVVGLGAGIHSVAVQGVTDQIRSAPAICAALIDPSPLTGLSCAPGDPCLTEALLGWDAVGPAVTSIEVSVDGVPTASFPPNTLGAGVATGTAGSHEVCVTARITGVDPETGNPIELDSDPTCCTVEIPSVEPLPVTDLNCTVDSSDCSAVLAWDLASTYSQIEVFLDGVSLFILAGSATTVTLTLPEGPSFEACVRATTACGIATLETCCTVTCGPQFVRGDANADGLVDLSDPIATLNFLFEGGTIPCDVAADTNADGTIDLSDPISLLGYLFGGGGAPPAPHPNCGNEPSVLDCVAFPPCP